MINYSGIPPEYTGTHCIFKGLLIYGVFSYIIMNRSDYTLQHNLDSTPSLLDNNQTNTTVSEVMDNISTKAYIGRLSNTLTQAITGTATLLKEGIVKPLLNRAQSSGLSRSQPTRNRNPRLTSITFDTTPHMKPTYNAEQSILKVPPTSLATTHQSTCVKESLSNLFNSSYFNEHKEPLEMQQLNEAFSPQPLQEVPSNYSVARGVPANTPVPSQNGLGPVQPRGSVAPVEFTVNNTGNSLGDTELVYRTKRGPGHYDQSYRLNSTVPHQITYNFFYLNGKHVIPRNLPHPFMYDIQPYCY